MSIDNYLGAIPAGTSSADASYIDTVGQIDYSNTNTKPTKNINAVVF